MVSLVPGTHSGLTRLDKEAYTQHSGVVDAGPNRQETQRLGVRLTPPRLAQED